MEYLLYLITPSITAFILFIVQKLGTKHWLKQHPNYSVADLAPFFNIYGSYSNPKDFRVVVKKIGGKGYTTNFGNPILILVLFITMISFPLINSFIRSL